MRSVRFFVLLALVSLLGTFAAPRAQDVPQAPSPIGIVLRNGVAGGLVGTAVAGGVVGYSTVLQGGSGPSLGRALALGAGLGVGAGLVLGMVVSSRHRAIPDGAVRDGLSRSLDARARDQSHSHLFPVLSRIF